MSETSGGERLPLSKCCRAALLVSLNVGEVALLMVCRALNADPAQILTVIGDVFPDGTSERA